MYRRGGRGGKNIEDGVVRSQLSKRFQSKDKSIVIVWCENTI